MTENPKVHFVELLQEEYDNSVAHSASTLYYCSDTKKMYKGDVEYSASGGNNDFVVTYTTGEGDTLTADKTFAEIVAAIEAGKNVSAKLPTGGGMNVVLSLAGYGTNEVVKFVTPYAQVEAGTATIFIVSIDHDAENTIAQTMQALQNAQG